MSTYLSVGLRDKNKDFEIAFNSDQRNTVNSDDIRILDYATSISSDLSHNVSLCYGEWTILTDEKVKDIQAFYQERIHLNENLLEQYKARYIEVEGLLLHADTDVAYRNLNQDLYDIREMQLDAQEELVSYYYRAAEWNVLEDIMENTKEKYNVVYLYE